MTRNERKYIEARAAQFRRWQEEERQAALSANSIQERDEHYEQERLNSCAALTLENLLKGLNAMKEGATA